MATMLKRAVHPGDVLRDELEERGVSPASFARQIDVPANRISQILAGKRAVTGDSALRFGHWFGMDPQFWLNLQAQYELGGRGTVGGSKDTCPAHRGRRRVECGRGHVAACMMCQDFRRHAGHLVWESE